MGKINVDYGGLLDDMERNFRLVSGTLDKRAFMASCVSTGVLAQDLVYGGGIVAGWNTIYGGEGAAKTTTVMCVEANCLNHEVPIVTVWDYEQADDPEYMEGILNNISPGGNYDNLFGVRSLKTGGWDINPRIRYYPHDTGEDFYKAMGSILRKLPDKVYMNGKWWYVFENTKEGRAAAGKDFDRKLYSKLKMFYVEADDGGRLQAIIILDSVQAMNPEGQEEDDAGNGMSEDARMHARHYKKIRGKLRKKNVAVIAVNQLRVKPGQMFGNPEYITGGNALKHATDVRNKQVARSSPNGAGPVEQEASVLANGASDSYKYIHIKNEKNKFATPHCEAWARIWIDHEGKGRGFCPVYDTYFYLLATGRITNKQADTGIKKGDVPKKLVIDWPEFDLKIKCGWLDFKALVIFGMTADTKEQLKKTCKNLGITKNPLLRQRAFEEMKSGKGFERYHSLRVGGRKVVGEIDDENIVLDDDDLG